MVVIRYPGVSYPSAYYIESGLGSVETFAHVGISLSEVQKALRALPDKFVIELPTSVSKALMVAACKSLVKRDSKPFDDAKADLMLKIEYNELFSYSKRKSSGTSSKEIHSGDHRVVDKSVVHLGEAPFSQKGSWQQIVFVVITVDTSNLEALSSALVLEELVSVHLSNSPEMLPYIITEADSCTRLITDFILICSSGVFNQPSVIKMLVRAAFNGATALAVIVDPAFKVPNIDTMKPGIDFYNDDDLAPSVVVESIANAFHEIAIDFRCSEVEHIALEFKAKETAMRLCMKNRRRSTPPESREPSKSKYVSRVNSAEEQAMMDEAFANVTASKSFMSTKAVKTTADASIEEDQKKSTDISVELELRVSVDNSSERALVEL